MQPHLQIDRATTTAGEYVSVKDTIKGFKMILDGDLDEVSENDFYMKGGMDQLLLRSFDRHGGPLI